MLPRKCVVPVVTSKLHIFTRPNGRFNLITGSVVDSIRDLALESFLITVYNTPHLPSLSRRLCPSNYYTLTLDERKEILGAENTSQLCKACLFEVRMWNVSLAGRQCY